jgi:hypothetical protein
MNRWCSTGKPAIRDIGNSAVTETRHPLHDICVTVIGVPQYGHSLFTLE